MPRRWQEILIRQSFRSLRRAAFLEAFEIRLELGLQVFQVIGRQIQVLQLLADRLDPLDDLLLLAFQIAKLGGDGRGCNPGPGYR